MQWLGAVGIGLAFRLSADLGLCAPADAARVIGHLASVGLPSELRHLNRQFSAERLVAHMRRDKKTRDGQLTFVLVRGVGPGVHEERRAGRGGAGIASR